MSGRRWLGMTVGLALVGIASMACSGTVSGTDLSSGDGGTSSGNGGGGLLGAVGTQKGSNNGGTTSSTSSSSSSGTATSQQGTQPSQGTTKGGVCGSGESTGIATCDSCLDPACCASIKACDANAECIALFNCAKACNGDRECGQDCRAQHPAGDADLQAFIGCFQSCEGACQ